MYLKRPTTKSTGSYWDSIKRLGEELETADAILIGAGGDCQPRRVLSLCFPRGILGMVVKAYLF